MAIITLSAVDCLCNLLWEPMFINQGVEKSVFSTKYPHYKQAFS